MKKTLLIISTLLVCTSVISQEEFPKYIPTNYQDSIAYFQLKADKLTLTELKKEVVTCKELYKKDEYKFYADILIYLEERVNILSDEK